MPKWSPYVNNLAYDDIIIFTSTDKLSLELIMSTLVEYETVCGQLINKAKGVFMHHQTSQGLEDQVYSSTKIIRKDFPFTYLECQYIIVGGKISSTKNFWINSKTYWVRTLIYKRKDNFDKKIPAEYAYSFIINMWPTNRSYSQTTQTVC